MLAGYASTMTLHKLSLVLALVAMSALPIGADAAPGPTCPAAVTSAVAKAFPKSRVTRCKAEREEGRDQFEARLTRADGGKLEVDVSPDGKILQTEEKIAVDRVPAAVMTAFAARYPHAKVSSAEKQTPATGEASYELAFASDHGRKEVTFTESGKFVEEE